ncbi:UNVERIFIED_CONTAM: hypothetical protein HDU68_007620 [Siphonaria sp. JEL0065]|nr:hypothetical protein HDU68_007620 [Siphonaria sp. JEL0065]
MKFTTDQLIIGVFSFLLFPASYAFALFLVTHTSWCLSDSCVTQPLIQNNLSIYYGFLVFTLISVVTASRYAALKRFLYKRFLLGSTITIGEATWFLLALAVLLICGILSYKDWSPKFSRTRSGANLILFTAFVASGDCLAVLFGLVMLPVSKHSFMATFVGVPYTSLLRVHIWLGRLMAVLTTFHMGALIASYVITKQDIIGKIFAVQPPSPYAGTTAQWGSSRYQPIMGNAAFGTLIIITVTSLSFFRRKWYNVFYFTHFLVLALIVLSYFHASSNVYYLLPGLGMYTIDGILRLYSRYTIDKVSAVLFEKPEYVTLTISTTKACRSLPGQFMRVCLPAISKTEMHPWSIVKSTETSVSFMFRRDGLVVGSWTDLVVKHLMEKYGRDDVEGVDVVLQGPFGAPLDVGGEKDVLVFFVGGTGLSAYLDAIRHVVMAFSNGQQGNVLVVWSTRGVEASSLSHLWELQELAGAGNNGKLVVEAIETKGDGSGRVDLNQVLEKYVSPLVRSGNDKNCRALEVGVYICGPAGFNKDAMKAAHVFSKKAGKGVKLEVDIGSYEL